MTRVSDALRERQTGHRPPAGDGDATDKTRDRWSREKKIAFALLEPAAIVLVATNGPISMTLWQPGDVPIHVGHNRAVWPARVAKTQAWKDLVTQTYDRAPLPELFFGAQFRVWCLNAHSRDVLALSVAEFMARRAEAEGGTATLREDCHDLGPDLDLRLFEFEVHGVARRLAIPAGDDAWISAICGATERRAREMAIAREWPVDERLIDRALHSVLDAELQRWGRG